MSEHPSDGQSGQRLFFLVVILTLMKIWVANDGVAADDVERQRLTGDVGRGGHGDRPLQVIGIVDAPLERHVPAHRTADDGQQFFDPQMVDQFFLRCDHVANRDRRKIGPVRLACFRIDRVGPGGPAAAAQNVRADDEETVGVDRFSRSDP